MTRARRSTWSRPAWRAQSVPFTLRVAQMPRLRRRFAGALQAQRREPGGRARRRDLDLRYGDASGLTARKTFSFTTDTPYVIGFAADVQAERCAGDTTVRWGPALGTARSAAE